MLCDAAGHPRRWPARLGQVHLLREPGRASRSPATPSACNWPTMKPTRPSTALSSPPCGSCCASASSCSAQSLTSTPRISRAATAARSSKSRGSTTAKSKLLFFDVPLDICKARNLARGRVVARVRARSDGRETRAAVARRRLHASRSRATPSRNTSGAVSRLSTMYFGFSKS